MAKLCPLMKEPCIEHGCAWYIQLLGNDPQTSAPMADWRCSVAFMPILTVENSQQQRQTAAAVESLRNEVAADSQRNFVLEAAKQFPHLIEGSG